MINLQHGVAGVVSVLTLGVVGVTIVLLGLLKKV
jgi:hypothetical protein